MRSENWVWVLAVTVFMGCGGDKPKERTGGVKEDPRCAAYTAATCGKMAQCWPWLLAASYGDMETCIQRSSGLCANVLTANGSSWTTEKIDACAQTLPTISCDTWWNSVAPACDPGPGQLQDGSACIDKSQCQGGTCLQGGASGCGVCSTISPLGGDCSGSAQCEPGTACSPEGKCVQPASLGGSCDASNPCAVNLRCGAEGKCVPLVDVGEACNPASFGDCNFFKGLACDPETETCKAVNLAPAGERCGPIDGQLTTCGAGAICSTQGVCLAPLEDGASCSEQAESRCAPPATCIGGVCTIPGANCG